MKKIVITGMLAFILLLTSSCSNNVTSKNNATKTNDSSLKNEISSTEFIDDKENTNSSESNTYTESSNNDKLDLSADFQKVPLGEGVVFDTGHEIYVEKIEITDEESNTFENIENNFVRVDFSFKNGESEQLTFTGPNVKLYNSDGSSARMSSKNYLYEEIDPGETKQLSAYFDAKNSPYTVVFGNFYWESN